MKLLITLIVAAFAVTNAFVIPHSVYGPPVPLIRQPLPQPGNVILSTTPLHGIPYANVPVHETIHVKPFFAPGKVQPEQPLNLLQTLRAQEESLLKQIEQLRSTERYHKTSQVYQAPTGNFETQEQSDLLHILLAQLEIIHAHIERIMSIQKIEQQIRDQSKQTEAIRPFNISTSVEDELPKETTDLPFRNTQQTTVASTNIFEKLPEYDDSENSLDLLATLTAQRDLVNLQIETFLRTHSGKGIFVPSDVFGSPYVIKENPTDWLSALFNHRDLLNLQINHVLTIPGFENVFNGQFQIFGTPSKQPAVTATPVNIPHSVQHSSNPTSVQHISHQESKPLDNTNVVTQQTKQPDELYTYNHKFGYEYTPATERPLIDLPTSTEKEESIYSHLNPVLAKFLKESTTSNIPLKVIKYDSNKLTPTLAAQSDSIDGHDLVKPHGIIETTHVPTNVQYEFLTESRPKYIQEHLVGHDTHFIVNNEFKDVTADNVGEILADVLRQRDLIERQFAALLPVQRPQYLFNNYHLLENQRNMLNIQIEHLLAEQTKFLNQKVEHVVIAPGYVYHAYQHGHTGNFFETTIEKSSEDYEESSDVLATLVGQSELIKVQLESLRAIEEAERKMQHEMHTIGLAHDSDNVEKHRTSDLILAFQAQKDFVDAEIEKIKAFRRKIQGVDVPTTVELHTVKPFLIEYEVSQENKYPVRSEERPLIHTSTFNIVNKDSKEVLNSLIVQRDILNQKIEVLLPFRKNESEGNFEEETESHELNLLNTLEAQRDLINVQIEQLLVNEKEEQKLKNVSKSVETTTPVIRNELTYKPHEVYGVPQ